MTRNITPDDIKSDCTCVHISNRSMYVSTENEWTPCVVHVILIHTLTRSVWVAICSLTILTAINTRKVTRKIWVILSRWLLMHVLHNLWTRKSWFLIITESSGFQMEIG